MDTKGPYPLVFYAMIPSVALSFFGTAFIMVSHFLFQRGKNPLNTIIFFMALSDLGLAFVWWFPLIFRNHVACMFQAPLLEFFAVASWLWPMVFSLRLYVSNIYERDINLMWLFHLICWGIPTLFCAICWYYKTFNLAGNWCWITDPWLQIFLGDGISVILFFIEAFVFAAIMLKIHRESTRFGQFEKSNKLVTLRFCLFLLIPIICWSWALADRLTTAITHKHYYWLQVLHAVAGTAQGFLNFCVYGLDDSLRACWAKFLNPKSPLIKIPKPTTKINYDGRDSFLRVQKSDHINDDDTVPLLIDTSKLYSEYVD